ncbi:MAG: glycosyltransferase family 4 protein [Gemmatimonas sp.]
MARVLLWSNAFWPLIGGVEVLGEKLATTLVRRGHELVVVTDRVAGFPDYSEHHGVRIHRLPMLDAVNSGSVDQWVGVRKRVSDIKREFRPQLVWDYLVQVDSMFHLMTESAHSAPTLATLHASFAPGMLGENSAVRKVMTQAAWTAACSSHALQETQRELAEIVSRSSVIWNGLDMPPHAVLPLPFDAPRLLCLGRIGSKEEKGFDVAITALREVVTAFPSTRLLIAGDGAGRAALEAHARDEGVAHAVDFLGWVHPDAVYDLMNQATVVMMPSRVPEGFGLSALQGQQMGRPVIASRLGGVAEVVRDGKTGLLVEPGNAESLSQAILSMLAYPDTAIHMGAAGRERAAMEFSFNKHADAYEALIERLVQPAGTVRV